MVRVQQYGFHLFDWLNELNEIRPVDWKILKGKGQEVTQIFWKSYVVNTIKLYFFSK
jgi:hypothetical protein